MRTYNISRSPTKKNTNYKMLGDVYLDCLLTRLCRTVFLEPISQCRRSSLFRTLFGSAKTNLRPNFFPLTLESDKSIESKRCWFSFELAEILRNLMSRTFPSREAHYILTKIRFLSNLLADEFLALDWHRLTVNEVSSVKWKTNLGSTNSHSFSSLKGGPRCRSTGTATSSLKDDPMGNAILKMSLIEEAEFWRERSSLGAAKVFPSVWLGETPSTCCSSELGALWTVSSCRICQHWSAEHLLDIHFD